MNGVSVPGSSVNDREAVKGQLCNHFILGYMHLGPTLKQCKIL